MNVSLSTNWTIALVVALVWDLVWRGLALWKSGRRNQPVWFVALFIINSLGILPIIYIVINAGTKDYSERMSYKTAVPLEG